MPKRTFIQTRRRLAHARSAPRACRPASTGSTSARRSAITRIIAAVGPRRPRNSVSGTAGQRAYRGGAGARLRRFRRRADGAVQRAPRSRLIGLLRSRAIGRAILSYDRPRPPRSRSPDATSCASTRWRSRLPAKRRATATSRSASISTSRSIRGTASLLSRRPLAQGGMVHATVFRDLNDNGVCTIRASRSRKVR